MTKYTVTVTFDIDDEQPIEVVRAIAHYLEVYKATITGFTCYSAYDSEIDDVTAAPKPIPSSEEDNSS